jgi:Zn-dependent M28 family amino/carboxypeptidase
MRIKRVVVLSVLVLVACTGDERSAQETPTPSSLGSRSTLESFDVARVVEVVRVLAGEIGPRETTSDAFRNAGTYVEGRLRALGYRASRQTFSVPAGLSNFASVPEGDTFNVIAGPPGFDPTTPHLIVGAHLDTVPQAPGAVDNATGIGIMIELARLASITPPQVPVVFIAFGGEEARVPNGGLHGSKAYVASLDAKTRAAVVGAVVIDRAGTGDRVPVCTAANASGAFASRFLAAARRVAVPVISCRNDSSDHLSFERVGIRAIRIGPDEFPEYHTPRDRPDIFVPDQAQRIGDLLWETL